MAAAASSVDALSVVVTPPNSGQPWASYTLSVCRWDGTAATNCVTPNPTCAAATQPGNPSANAPSNCTVGSLASGQQYRVIATASKAGQTSVASAPSFAFTPWP